MLNINADSYIFKPLMRAPSDLFKPDSFVGWLHRTREGFELGEEKEDYMPESNEDVYEKNTHLTRIRELYSSLEALKIVLRLIAVNLEK